MQLNLPQKLLFEAPAVNLAGLMDPEPCNAHWRACQKAVEDLYNTCAGLEMAVNRQRYSRLASLSLLGRRLDSLEEALGRSGRRDLLSPLYNTDWNPAFYEYPPADIGANKIQLPLHRERRIATASINVHFPEALEFTQDDPSLLQGGTWRATVKSRHPIRLLPDLPWADNSGCACQIQVVFARPQALNLIRLQPSVWPPMDLIKVVLVDEHGATQIICAPSREGRFAESRPLTDAASLTFPAVVAKEAHILLYQRHGRRIERSDGRQWYEYYFGLEEVHLSLEERLKKAHWVSLPLPVDRQTRRVYLDATKAAADQGNIEFDLTVDGKHYLPLWIVRESNAAYEEFVETVPVGDAWRGVLRFPAVGTVMFRDRDEILTAGQDYIMEDERSFLLRRKAQGPLKARYHPDSSAFCLSLRTLRQEHTEEFAGTDEAGEIILAHHIFVDSELVASLPPDWDPSVLGGGYVPVEVMVYTADGRVLTQPSQPGAEGIRNITPYRMPAATQDGITYLAEENRIVFNQPFSQDNKIVVKYESLPQHIRLRVTLKNITASGQAGPSLSDIMLSLQ